MYWTTIVYLSLSSPLYIYNNSIYIYIYIYIYMYIYINISIPTRFDPAPFWAKYVQRIISIISDILAATTIFIDNLCTINENVKFLSSFRKIYPNKLELKLENQGKHASNLDLDITIEDEIFVYKLFDKRDKFELFCCSHA